MKFIYFISLFILSSLFPVFGQQSSTLLYFDVDDHSLTNESKQLLDQLYLDLEKHSDYKIQIIGHTDQDGSDDYNEQLAQKRTNAVEDYLTSVGYPVESLEIDWKGEQQLLYADNSSVSKQKNRRVEVISQYWDYETVDDLVSMIGNTVNPTQNISCDTKTSQFFDLQQGTSVFIPANAFQFADGSAPVGKVELEFVEAFSYTDMVTQSLSTHTKDEMLETGGMIYIEASSEGKPLELVEGKSIEFIFPLQKEEEGMELFYGDQDVESGTVSWTETGQSISTTQVKNDPLQIDFTPILEYDFGIIEKPTILFEDMPARPRRLKKPFPPSKQLYHGEKYHQMYASYEANLKAYNEQLPKLTAAEAKWQEEVTRRVERIEDFKKEISEFKYARKLYGAVRSLEAMKDRRAPVELLARLFSFTKKPYIVKLDQRVTYMNAFGNYTREVVDEHKLEVYQREHLVSVNKMFVDLKKIIADTRTTAREAEFARTGKIGSNGLASYVTGINTLGWINCDRFLNDQNITDLKVHQSEDFVLEAKYYMIFKDVRSLYMGTRLFDGAVFKNVPAGQDVKIVSVKVVDQKPYLAVLDHTIDYDEELALTYFPSSLQQIKEELNSVDPIYREETQKTKEEKSLTMFPNPTSDDFTVSVESEADLESLEVYDMKGTLVKRINGSGIDEQAERVSVTDMCNGVYVVNAKFSDGEITSDRIVVQH